MLIMEMLELNLERLTMAIEDLLVMLSKLFQKPKSQTVFLISNYDLTNAVLKLRIRVLVLITANEDCEGLCKQMEGCNRIEVMHNDVITSFSNFLCGMDGNSESCIDSALALLHQAFGLHLAGGSVLNKDLLTTISPIMYEIREYELCCSSCIKSCILELNVSFQVKKCYKQFVSNRETKSCVN